MKKVFFCPRCHKKIIPPKFILEKNVVIKGSVSIKCPDKNCTGTYIVKPKKEKVENAADINNG